MSKSFRSGHSFPSAAGFTGSTGKVTSVKPHSRKVGTFARSAAPVPGPPPQKPKLAVPAVLAPLGHSLTHRAKPVTQEDALHGGKGPLLAGFKRGGKVGKC